jgi:hypothetical protein
VIPSQLSQSPSVAFLDERCVLATVAKTRQFVKPQVLWG